MQKLSALPPFFLVRSCTLLWTSSFVFSSFHLLFAFAGFHQVPFNTPLINLPHNLIRSFQCSDSYILHFVYLKQFVEVLKMIHSCLYLLISNFEISSMTIGFTRLLGYLGYLASTISISNVGIL